MNFPIFLILLITIISTTAVNHCMDWLWSIRNRGRHETALIYK